MRIASLLMLVAFTTGAPAATLNFDSVLYDTSAFAEVGADSDGPHDASGAVPALPITSSAAVIGGDRALHESAFAASAARDMALAVDTSVQATQNHAGAVAEASFAATLNGDGHYRLDLDFDTASSLQGASAGASLGLAFSIGANTLFDETFSSSGHYVRTFDLAAGDQGVLNISLIGTGDVDLGYGFNRASVNFGVSAVPLPAALFLMPAALFVAGRFGMRRQAA